MQTHKAQQIRLNIFQLKRRTNINKQEGHDGPISLTLRNRSYKVVFCFKKKATGL
jgi:hypothetical protein